MAVGASQALTTTTTATQITDLLNSIMPLLMLVLVMGLIVPMFKDLAGSMKG